MLARRPSDHGWALLSNILSCNEHKKIEIKEEEETMRNERGIIHIKHLNNEISQLFLPIASHLNIQHYGYEHYCAHKFR